MTILWLILKIILWILVGLISVFCLLLLGILFLPIIYEMEGEEWDTLRGKVKLNIFHILKIDCDLSRPEDIKIKLFGFKLNFNPFTNEEEEERLKEDREKDRLKDRLKEEKVIQRKESKDNRESQVSIVQDKGSTQKVQKVQREENKENSKIHRDRVDKKNDIFSRRVSEQTSKKSFKQIRKTTHSNKQSELDSEINKGQKSPTDKSKASFKEIFEELKYLWDLEERKPFFRSCKKLLLSWWRALKPYYLYFEVIFGLEDPSETGLWLAKLMAFYPFYAPYGQVIGNFEEQVLQGYIKIKGKTRLIKFLYPTLVFIAHKEVRIIIKNLMNFGKDDKNGIKTQ
nr:hypothetical protein [uncultured Niameybacter sp.]